MTDNVFLRSPLQNALAKEREAMAARAAARAAAAPAGLAGSAAPTMPGSAGASTPPAADPRAAIEAASVRYNVPSNLIMALGETAGLSPEDAPRAADAIGAALAAPLSAGRKHSEALREMFPDAPEGFEKAVVARSNAIYAEIYAPKPAEPAAAEGGGGLMSDAAATLGGSINRSIGSGVRGLGEAIAAVGDYTTTPLAEAITGEDYGPTQNVLAPIADAIQTFAKRTGSDLVSEDTKRAIRDSSPDGNLFRPSTWDLGDAPSLRGYTMLALDVFGSLVPVVAAGAVSGVGAAAAVGGATGGGSGAETASQIIDQMAQEKTPDGRTRLEAESAYYRSLIANGMPPEHALRRTKAAGERMAFLFTAPVSAAGGALTSKILNPASKIVEGGSRLVRTAGRGALSAAEEGTQEAAETVAARSGANAGAGTDVSVTDGTFGDFILGALAGGMPGAAAGAMSAGGSEVISGPPAAPGPKRLALPAPTSGGAIIPEAPAPGESPGPVGAEAGVAGGGGVAAAAPSAPAGPVESALRAGPGAIAPDMRPGDRVTIEPEGVGPIDGTFVSESAGGVRVRSDDGEDFEIPREEIEAGATRLQLAGPLAAEPVPATPPQEFGLADLASRLAQWKPAPAAAPAPITDLDVARQRLAYIEGQAKGRGWDTRLSQERAKAQAAIAELEGAAVPAESVEAAHSDPIPPAAPPATAPDAIRMKNGKPFATIGQARQAVRKRGLEPDDFSYPREGKGLVAVPKGGAAPSQNTRARAAERAPEKRTVIAPLDKDGAPTGPKVIINRLSREEMEAELDAKAAPKAEEEPEVVAASPAEPAIPAPPVEAIPGRPAVAAATPAASGAPAVRQIREKAGKLSGVDQATADRLSADLGIKLSPDSTGGYTFSWKHAGRLRAAIEQPAEKATDGSGQGAAGKEKPPVAAQRREKPAKQPPAAIVTQLNGPAGDPVSTPAEIAVMDAAIDEMIAARKPTDVEEERTVPAGHTLGSVKKLTKAEAKARASYPEVGDVALTAGDFQAIVSRHAPYAVFSGYGPTRAAAINAAIARAERNAPKPAATSTPAEIKAEAKAVDTTPTDGQKEAGNYQMGHIKVHGHDVTIETPKGATRRGKAPDGTEWSVKMPAHYGYIRRTEGADGDHVDVYVGENPGHPRAFVVDQFDPETDRFDEHKVVLGAITEAQATAIYDAGFSDDSGPRRRKAVSEYSVESFSLWLRNGDPTKPAAWRSLERDAAITRSIVGAERQRRENVAKLEAIKADTPPDSWGAGNKLVTGARAAELRDRLKAKLRDQINAGIDPEIIAIGTELMVFHIEAGARRFLNAAKAIADDLGSTPAALRPYLRSWYNGARDLMEDSGHSIEGMDDAAAVRAGLATIEEASKIEAGRDTIQEPPSPAEPPAKPEEDGGADAEHGRDGADDDAPLDDLPPEEGEGLAAGRDAEAGDGGGDADGSGDGDAGADRSPARGGLVRHEDDVLPDRPAGSDRRGRAAANGPFGRDEELPHRLTGDNPGNHRIDAEALGKGTESEKVAANLAAIRLALALDREGRFATPEEQVVLARYVGWGGLKSVFDVKKKDGKDFWGRAYRDLKELLTRDEYEAAFDSVRNAHYTAPGVVQAMWRAVRHFGFAGGRALEPTVGVGNFLGLQPEDMAAATEWHAAELDFITGKIARHLYPEANIFAGTGFEDAPFADGAFDVAIGNPPFGSNTITDKTRVRAHLSGMKVHNYVIAKTGMHLRPGGVMAMVVTHRFLDTANPEARDVLARQFRFIGAIRLPNDAFKANAGTEVTTDIVFLQKLRADETPDLSAAWLDTGGEVAAKDGPARVNRYFAEHPEHVLGTSTLGGTMYGGRGGEYAVRSDGRDLGAAIDRIVSEDWRDLAGTLHDERDADVAAVRAELTTSDLPVGGMGLIDGKIRRRDLDDEAGNAVVEDITPESYWREQAALWSDAVDAAKALRDAKGVPAPALLDAWNEASAVAFAANGERKAKPTRADQAVYDLTDAIARPAKFEWAQDDGLAAMEAALERKRLGREGYDTLRGMLDLRNRTLALLAAERADDPSMEALRADLNARYDAFVAAHGFVSDPANVGLLGGDVGPELGLEAHYKPAVKGEEAKRLGVKPTPAEAVKADLMSRRVFFPRKEITSAADVADGVRISLSERGRLDLGYIAKLTGKPVKEVIDALSGGDAPTIFFDPETDAYEHAEAYLAGNVRHKLDEARKAGLSGNVRALEAAQPAPKTKEQIEPTIRSQWIPAGVFETFLTDLGVQEATILSLPSIGKMSADGKGFAATPFGQQFMHESGRPAASVLSQFNALAAGKTLTIYDKDGDRLVVNKQITEEVGAIMERMASTFKDWVYADPDRTRTVVDAFNQKMNTHRRRSYNGVDFLRLVGASPSVSLRRTQKDAAWRMILEPTVLLDHVVGAGKTYTIAAGVMERKRLGLSRKPMIVVPNHLVVQWAREFYHLYPGARILAATPDDFARKNRRRLLARIATGNYDAVIIGHTSLGFIETPADDVSMVLNEKMDELKRAMEDARAAGESKRTLTQIRNKIEKYEERLEKLLERPVDEIGITFGDMGVDYLAVDEAHEFKNVEYGTGGERVVGMNDPNGSKKAFDLYVKIRGLRARGGAVTFATGTPVSNSLVELYTVMNYLANDELQKRGLAHFDSWSAAYAQTQTRLEYTPTQKIKARRVLSGLVNLSSLVQLYHHFADTISMDDIKRIYAEDVAARNKATGGNERTQFPVPRVKDGGRVLDSGGISDRQAEFMDYLVARMDAIQANAGDKDYPKIDNPLWVLSDARKMSLDIRAVDPTARRDDNGKVARAAEAIKRNYDRWRDDLGAQLVFCDLSTPAKTSVKEARKMVRLAAEIAFGNRARQWIKAHEGGAYAHQWALIRDRIEAAAESGEMDQDDAARFAAMEAEADGVMLTADTGFSVYDDLRDALVEKGIPEREVAFIHDYNTPDQKARLFARVNAGQVRVLMGSSQKMGAGTNAQKRLVALHHMDAPWRPSDVEQREGRIIRQGNDLYARDPDGFEVEINAYSTSGTSDTVMWQILERKAGAIEQFRNGDIDRVEEEGGDSDQYAEFMATSTGNPVFRLKLEAERELTRLRSEVGGLVLAQSNAQAFLKHYDERIGRARATIAGLSGRKAGDISFGGKTASADDFAKALVEVRDDFEARYAAYTEAYAKAFEAQQQSLAAGKEVSRLPSLPKAPSRPTIISKTVTEKSPYAAIIVDALAAVDEGRAVEATIGDVKVRLTRAVSPFNEKEFVFRSEILVGGEWVRITTGYGLKANLNENLQRMLTPQGVQDEVDYLVSEARRTEDRLEERRPGEEKAAATHIDQSAIRETQDLVEWFGAKVALAESEADRKRAGRYNRYIEGDTKRPLRGGGEGASDTQVRTFTFEGHTYEGTGLAAGRGGRALYEATRKHDGWRAVVIAQPKEGAAGEVEAVRVLLEPESTMEDMEDKLGTAEGVRDALHKFSIAFSDIDAAAKMDAGSLALWEDDGGPALPHRRPGRAFKDVAALRKHLASAPRLVERLIGEGRIVLHDTIATLPGGPHGRAVQGMTDGRGVIHLVATMLTPQNARAVLLHEVFHSGVEPLIGSKAWSTLMARTARMLAQARERATTGRTVGSQAFWDRALARIEHAGEPPTPEELAAYAIEESAQGAPAGLREVVENILGAVKAFILRRFGRQLGAVTPAELRSLAVAALRSGTVGAPAGPGPARGTSYSVAPPPGSFTAPGIPAATDAQIEAAERGLIGNVLTRAMAGDTSILGLAPGRPLFAELAKKTPAAQEYLRLKLEMDALRNQWHARMDGTAQAWRKLIGQDGAANAKLMDIMHEATLLGADPTRSYDSILNDNDREALAGSRRGRAWEIAAARGLKDEERRAEHARLRRRLRALPEAFQKMFGTIRDEYKALNDEFERTLLDNIDRAMAVGLRTAERAHEAEIERIRDDGLTGKERADAIAAADKRLAAAKWRHGANKRARMADLRARFETQQVPAPYFPLARFGSFFVTARDKETGEVVHFSRHERPGPGALDAVKHRLGWDTGRSQQEVAREMRAKGYAVEVGVIGETDIRQMVDPAFVADVEAILDTANVPEAVMDSVWQRWLETLPDLSIRKNRVHRKGTPGFDTDAFRAFGHHMFHGAHQLARLRYAMLMEESLDLAGTQAKNQDDPVRAGLVFEEMRRRHAYTMNPKGAWWAQAATSAAFVYYLAMSPAAAIVNLTQTSIIGTPVLAAGFEKAGIAGAASALGKALTDFTRGRGHASESGRLSADEKAAMGEAYRRGTIDKSQAHDLAGVGETGVEYSAARAKVMSVISWFFHHTERMNREITFLAAYRMGRDAGLDHFDAIDKASDLTWKTHFDYANTSRPRLMQNDAARVALVFRNYSVNMLWRLVRDVHQSINAKDPAERREAIRQLGGITAGLFLHAGARGVWGYSLAMAIVGLFFAGGSDDAEDELKKGVVSTLGTQIGGMVLNGVPGHLSGTNLTSRIGMPDLWFRSPDRQLEGEDEYHYWLSEVLGAAVGIAETGFRGVSMIRDGEVYRGIETMLPKALRDIARAGRYAFDGVRTMKGDDILADPGVAAIITQALGFTPAAVAERYETNTKMKNAEQRIMDERSEIMADYASALRAGRAVPDSVLARLRAFNAAHPSYPITRDSLRASARGRAQASARNESGIVLNPKLNRPIRDAAAPLIYE